MTVLITGASSGIGYELAKVFAKHKHNLVIIARSSETLKIVKEHLEKTFGIDVMIIVKDLSDPYAPKDIYDEIIKSNIQINILVNNAGFGDYGWFYESDLIKNHEMIQVNIDAVTQLTRLFLPEMIKRKDGKILNVASTAAFQPGPLMTVYYATKAYVLSFSEGLAEEIEDKGITVTALCPGPTTSNFQKIANMGESNLIKNKNLPTSSQVAEYGYHSLMKGKRVAIHGIMNSIQANMVKFAPRKIVTRMVKRIQQKQY